MRRILNAALYGATTAALAVGAVIALGMLSGWEDLRSPGFLNREAAWFALFTVYGSVWSWYGDRRVERATCADRSSGPGGTVA